MNGSLRAFFVPFLALLIFSSSLSVNSFAQELGFSDHIAKLAKSKLSEKAVLISLIAETKDARVPDLFQHLLNGDLYYVKKTGQIVVIEKTESGYLAGDVLSQQSLGIVGKRSVKKIGVNNALRRQLRSYIATFNLSSDEANTRLEAAKALLKAPEASFLPILDAALVAEANADVRSAMVIARSAILLASDNAGQRLVAVNGLRGATDKKVMTLLEQLLLEDEEGNVAEPNVRVRQAAEEVLGSLHTQARIYKVMEDLFFGISLGSVLLLAAIGLAITFGVMGVINMAHGEMIMLGAYTTYVVQLLMPNNIGLSLVVAVPAAFLVSGLFGVIIERSVIRFLYGRPLETLLATFGISLMLQQLVRSVFTPLNRSVITPEWMSGSWEVNGMLSLTYNRLYIIFFALAVLFLLIQLLKRTFFGLQMRAVTQNRAMASSMGIRTGWVDAMTFGLGSGVAGIAGVALSQLTNVGPNMGQAYIIDSFMVVVFGGVGNLLGTFVGAMSLGIVNKFAEPMVGAVLAKILILVFVILFIQRRPRGLFALKGRFVED
ncbi:MAG: urea ABC transporter permease subunit UrtB [Porticoccaceae bacterium]|nr:urea ABC transporter permease subunit UrtB [Porticoccaceae bacterium]